MNIKKQKHLGFQCINPYIASNMSTDMGQLFLKINHPFPGFCCRLIAGAHYT